MIKEIEAIEEGLEKMDESLQYVEILLYKVYGGENWNEHVNRLIDLADEIEPGKLTILTGGNESGKSFILKILWQRLAGKLGFKFEDKSRIAEISMMKRCGLDYNCGINFLRDDDWIATSQNSFKLAKDVLGDKMDGRFIVMDEPEIGFSEEAQLTLAKYINSRKDQVLNKNYGILVITHSRIMVKEIQSDVFLNIEGLSKDVWLTREVIPFNIDQFEKDAEDLFVTIRDRSKTKSSS